LGFYGKLPSHGDFLRRRVSDAFVEAWDHWLQECMAASQSALGDKWLEVYLTSPAWRFACSAGACGPVPVMGLMAPSVDRVGRYFPFTLVVELPAGESLLTAIRASEAFFNAAERLVIAALESDPLDFGGFDERVIELGREYVVLNEPGVSLDTEAAAALVNVGIHEQWQIPVGTPASLAAVFEQLLTGRLSSLYEPPVVWWTEGSSLIEPSLLIVKGLPAPESFVALLDGSWSARSWQPFPVEARAGQSAEASDDTLPIALHAQFRSAAASNVGRVRRVNQDAFIERPDIGMWAVADGLGGYSEGEVASRMVCDALGDLVPSAEFEQLLDDARRRLGEVNAYLHGKATRAEHAVRSGSTVVAMFTRGARCAVMWAGDSRVYRWRDGQLEQLTRDHSVAEEEGHIGADASTAITRAVGGESQLLLDVRRERVMIGDRFLLCSDGLTRMVSSAQIAEWLGQPDIQAAANGLITTTLGAGAPDNVTALVVEAFPVAGHGGGFGAETGSI
jgi:type VI secretion system protein ImpM